jgi:hypothetical protein
VGKIVGYLFRLPTPPLVQNFLFFLPLGGGIIIFTALNGILLLSAVSAAKGTKKISPAFIAGIGEKVYATKLAAG